MPTHTDADVYRRYEKCLRANRKTFNALTMAKRNELDLSKFMGYMIGRGGPSTGALVEARIIHSKNWTKVPASSERGDAVTNDGSYYEIKVSTHPDSDEKRINFVQIRPHQEIDGYYLCVMDLEAMTITPFVLTKKQMAAELETMRYPLAHGTNAARAGNMRPEYAIRFKTGDVTHQRWVQEYQQDIIFA